MYRIVSVRGTYNNFRQLTVKKFSSSTNQRLVWTTTNSILQHHGGIIPEQTILQIDKNAWQIRMQSTTASAENISSQKKMKRKYRGDRFVELLQVTDHSTRNTKTKVENLKAKNLSNFVLTSNLPAAKKSKKKKKNETYKVTPQPIEYQKVNLEILDSCALQAEVYDERPLIFFGKEKEMEVKDMNEILKSFNNFREIIETIRDEYNEEINLSETKPLEQEKFLNSNELEDVIGTVENLDVKKNKKKTVSSKKHGSERFKSKIHISAEQEKLAKHKSLLINLSSYLNVCVSVGALNRGFNVLLTHRQRYKKIGLNTNLFTIDLYNILLHGYASKGNYEKIREICEILKDDNISLNHQTFAAILECLGRLEPTDSNKILIEKYKNKADKLGITLNDIVDKSKFQIDQREIVLDSIRRIQPEFQPIYSPPILTYSNQLLTVLNRNIDEIYCNNSDTESKTDCMNPRRGFTKKQLQELARQQLKIELEGSLTVKSVEDRKDLEISAHCREKFDELLKLWRSQICTAINRDLNMLRVQSRYKHGSMSYYTYLKTLEPNQYANILLREIRLLAEGSETYSPSVLQLYKELGQKVYAKYQIEQNKKNGVLDKIGDIYTQYCEKLEKGGCGTDNSRQMWQLIVYENSFWGPNLDFEEAAWPSNILIGVGRFLYNILMRDIKIDANITRVQKKSKQQNLVPAFYTLFRNQGKTVKQEVKPHPILSRLLRSSRQKTLTFDSSLVPMLCPPQPWSTPINGGYLLYKSELIRLPQQAIQQWSRIKEGSVQQIYPAIDSLNQLASIPWKVNTDILDVILEIFNNGGDEKLDVARPPSALPPLPTELFKKSDLSGAEKFQLFRQKMNHRKKQAEMYSLWCDTLYRLSLANHYRDKIFWLPHNMDFRGRVYPIPPHLNHLGSDLARSLLVFGQAEPLGVDGFSWLKLHCINLTGMKKRDSIRERILYAEEVMDDIIDSADNPLTGRRWWTKSDEPWQTLACCMEIAKVSRCSNPEEYLCHLPIHQDGSCNGLQHYAALGRDKSGAVSVNLTPSLVPQDVYSAVAQLVEKSRETDANNGLHVAQILNGYVRRKVIKQTVMTTVYGVTRYGARLQIAKQLKDIDEFPKEWVWPASTYLTTKTFESLREMFTSTKEIQDWFTDCARLISTVCGQNVEWITPLGLPIVQPYSRQDPKMFNKNRSKINDNVPMDMYERPNVMKQKNAFPPNFIHSLDSSHMMLTSLFCERKGITFMSVHDCFWTHANTVPVMNKICREQFVALHSQPILEELSNLLVQKYSFNERDLANDDSLSDLTKQKLNKLLRQVPQKGNFNLKSVLESVYFFS